MQWGSWQEFLAMGGYAKYVWPAYAITAVAMIAEVIALVRRHRALRAQRGRTAAKGARP